MTLEEVITELQERLYCCMIKEESETLHRMIDALRDQMRKEKNDKLTLDELRAMDGQPVYVVSGTEQFWALVNVEREMVFDYLRFRHFKYHGTYWRAYRRPPESKG